MYSVPEAISKFNSSSIIIKENSHNSNVLDTIVTWGLPCSLNGELEFFNVSVYGTRNKYPPHSFYKIHKCKEYIHNDYMCLINLNELKGEYNYTFSISTKVMNVDTLKSTSESKLYPAGSMYQYIYEYIIQSLMIHFLLYQRIYLIVPLLRIRSRNILYDIIIPSLFIIDFII